MPWPGFEPDKIRHRQLKTPQAHVAKSLVLSQMSKNLNFVDYEGNIQARSIRIKSPAVRYVVYLMWHDIVRLLYNIM